MDHVILVGWFSTVCFSVSAIPQTVRAVREGHADGVAHGTLWAWLLGEAGMLYYSQALYADLILLVNYAANLSVLLVLAWYRYFPRSRAKKEGASSPT